VARLKCDGASFDQARRLLEKLDIQPTVTSHPTETRRPSVLHKQRRISALLADLQNDDLVPREREESTDELKRQIAGLLVTHPVATNRPTVDDEVEQGLYFLGQTIWEAVPRIHQDAERALERHYGTAVSLPPFLRYRSWIGGDGDGNPDVTLEVSCRTIKAHIDTALGLLADEVHEQFHELSISDRLVKTPRALDASIRMDRDQNGIDPDSATSTDSRAAHSAG